MRELNFSTNWNNKLDCKMFTTLRLSNRFEVNDRVSINLKKGSKKEFLFNGIVMAKKRFKVKEINDFIAGVDTGYSSKECINIIKNMYKGIIGIEEKLITMYLIKRA